LSSLGHDPKRSPHAVFFRFNLKDQRDFLVGLAGADVCVLEVVAGMLETASADGKTVAGSEAVIFSADAVIPSR
jgi:hypothetical protein